MKVSFPTTTPAEADLVHSARMKPANSTELKAAREFEQIFVRKMLSSLEKTGRMGQSGSFSGGSDIYSSMVVDGLANAIASSGGIGLADLIVQSMRAKQLEEPSAAATPSPAESVGKSASSVQPTLQASHEATVSDSSGAPTSESAGRTPQLRRQRPLP